MNLEERVVSTQRPPHSSETKLRDQDQRLASIERRGASLSSIPSDTDWVSPFTLPALPTLGRGRDQVNLLKSPEQARQRGGSGAYYAAAWGSPYASPSPESASRRIEDRRKSYNSAFQSPPYHGHSPLARGPSSVRPSLNPGNSPEPRRQPVRLKSERPNWLSDSDDSNNGKYHHRDRTPRPSAELASWGPSPDRNPLNRLSPRSRQSHQTQESTDTVTPETFSALRPRQSSKAAAHHRMSQIEEPPSDLSPENETFKPLPGLPRHARSESLATSKLDGPSSPIRPPVGSLTSPQRQRKKVVWKGKSCIISLPMTDRESSGLPPILLPQEVRDNLDALRSMGYSTRGFELTDVDGTSATFGNGQSCEPYPDPTEMSSERQTRSFKVYIPDQSEWQRWVEYLQEEKLRALGVTSSDSEPVHSGPSPLSASLSRNSSRFPGATSPPVGNSSAANNPTRITSNPFSPPFSASSGRGSAVGSGTSSQLSGYPGAMHGYKGSVALPIGHGWIPSPVEFVSGQTSPYMPGGHPPLNAHLRRPTGFSPINTHGVQSLDQILSPTSGPPSGQQPSTQTRSSSYFSPAPLSQSAPRAQDLGGQVLHVPAASQTSVSAPRTPSFIPRPGPEIQHPTPRSHKHNLSAALQKEIDDAEAAFERQDREQVDVKYSAVGGQNDGKSAQVEDDHEDPPILRRPETLGGMDDQSDIVTNPSLAGTPALLSDGNLFKSWQSLSDAARGSRDQVSKGYQAKLSQAKFNVEAKEFDPAAGFKSSNFNFGSSTGFTPLAAPFKPAVEALDPVHATESSVSRFNVEAPTFIPGGFGKPPRQDFEKPFVPEQSSFAFSSAAFNVDAPVFNPSESWTQERIHASDSEGNSDPPKTSIFGKVSIKPGTQATRRSKALPITRPRSKDGPQRSASSASSENAESEEDDEDGRAPIPNDRAKRARTVDSDGDRSPVYADSAPFTGNSRILSEIVNEASTRDSPPGKLRAKPVDGWSYIPAESEEHDEKSPVFSQGRSTSATESPSRFSGGQDVVKFSEANASDPAPLSEIDAPEYLASSPVGELAPSPPPIHNKPRSSLSALAEPFEFSPNRKTKSTKPTPSMSTNEPEKAAAAAAAATSKVFKPRGLMASRFANSSPPETPSSQHLDVQEASPSPQVSDVRLPISMTEEVTRDEKVSQNVDDPAGSEFEGHGEDSSTTRPATNPGKARSQGHISNVSPVGVSERDRLASLASSRYTSQNLHHLSLTSSRYGPEHNSVSIASPAYIPGRKELPKVEFSDDGDDLMPSFEEIDAVMRQFEHNPELGIERNDSPVQSTPLVDVHLGNNLRSDAPSPTPRRSDRHIEPTEAATAASSALGLGIRRLNIGNEEVSDWNDAFSSTEVHKLQSRAQFFDSHVNDLFDGILESRLGPFERSLQTIQHSLALVATRPPVQQKGASSDIRESDADDEDEYNAYEGFSSYRSRSPDAKRNRYTSRVRAAVAEGLAQFRESLPQHVAPTLDLTELRDELAEVRELVRNTSDNAPLRKELGEMRQLLEKSSTEARQKDLKRTLNEVIGSHPRLTGSRAEQDHGSSAGNIKLQLDGLEAMLKVEQERAEHEARLRKQREDDMQELRRKLQEAEDEAAGLREATEMTEQKLQTFMHAKEAYKDSELKIEELNLIIDEQEENLNEYRRYKEERQGDMERLRDDNNALADDLEAAREKAKGLSFDLEDERSKVRHLTADLRDEHAKNNELSHTLWDVKDQLEERTKTSCSLHSRIEELRDDVANAVRDLGTEQAEWRRREHELLTKLTIIEGALESAIGRQKTAEVDHDYVAKQLKDALTYKDRFDSLQQGMRTLQEELSNSRATQNKHEDNAYRLERDLHFVKESKAADIAAATARLQAEADGARSQLEGLRSDSEARISRLQARLDTAEIDLEDHKAKYDSALAEAEEARKQALQELGEKHEASLEEQLASHDRHLADLRDRHTRAMHNSSDDRHRMEHHYNEKIALSEDKIHHLESKIVDLEERLQVSKSAARAAVEAAMAKGANLPTPAPSVVASPPQRAQSASLSMVKGTEIPEKISVQSLRETILNLTEQVSERQQKVEVLEAQLSKVDKDLPNQIKAYENQAAFLRELLSVRVDEIEEIIQSISQPDFDREAVKDAAIRLKTNIQMEQQIRERAATNAGVVPALTSLASLASYAQSPRTALPMVATAAWGNFRKARDVSINTLGQLANDYVTTPSKPARAVSPASSWSSGIMTPPGTVQHPGRTPSNSDASTKPPPPTMRPLAAAAAARKMGTPAAKSVAGASEARPLRAFGAQPRSLRTKFDNADAKDLVAEHDENSSPRTPTMAPGREEMDLGEDIDDDASPLDARGQLRPFDDLPPKPIEARADNVA